METLFKLNPSLRVELLANYFMSFSRNCSEKGKMHLGEIASIKAQVCGCIIHIIHFHDVVNLNLTLLFNQRLN